MIPSKIKLRCSNQKGFSLIELLIAGAIGVMLSAATIYVFNKQHGLMQDQNADTNLRALGRLAITEMVKEIRRAGYGFPRGNGITNAAATTVTFRANTEDIYTTLTADVNSGTGQFDVTDNSNFTVGDNIVIFPAIKVGNYVENTDWEVDTIQGLPSGKISTNNNLSASYNSDKGVFVHKYHTVVYSYDAGNSRITRQEDSGATVPVINNVSAVTFTYYDNTDTVTATLADIRRIEVSISLVDPDRSNASITMTSDINIRNQGV